MKILLVALGSGLGGVMRYIVSRLINEHSSGLFPWSTFAVNITGCFLIGLIYGLGENNNLVSPNSRLFLTTGFCGGFTTFSTFAHENYLLFESGNALIIAAYAGLSFFIGILMAYLGHTLVS